MQPRKPLRYILLAGLAATAAGAASAGEWKLDPALCPDLREDRIDARVDHGPRDRREDLRDMRQVTCPRSAWVYVPGPGETPPKGLKYAGPLVVHVGRYGYYRAGPRKAGKPVQPALINIIIRD